MSPRQTKPGTSPAMDRRDTTYYGLFGNITEFEANYVDYQMDEILVAGYQNIVVSLLFGA